MFISKIADYIMSSERRDKLIVGLYTPADIAVIHQYAQQSGRQVKELKKILLSTYHVITSSLLTMWRARYAVLDKAQKEAMCQDRIQRKNIAENSSSNSIATPVPHMYNIPGTKKSRRYWEPP
jgi:hypothetical protein